MLNCEFRRILSHGSMLLLMSGLYLSSLQVQAATYAALGASDAVGEGASDYVAPGPSPSKAYVPQLRDYLLARSGPASWTLNNYGVGGYTAPDIVANTLTPATTSTPKVATVYVGGNDVLHIAGAVTANNDYPNSNADPALNYQNKLTQFANAYGSIIGTLKQVPGIVIVTANVPKIGDLPAAANPPYNLDATQRAQLNQIVSDINTIISSVASSQSVPVVDVYGDARSTDPAYLAADGFHPNDVGYTVIADAFKAKLQAALPDNQSLIVTTTADNSTANDGLTTLREAIAYANSHAGADTVAFNIPAEQAVSGVFTITPSSALPTITGTNGAGTTIDGYTQPGATPNTLSTGSNAILKIELNGVSKSFVGVTIGTPNCTVKGLVINRFYYGIALSWNTANNTMIQGNYVGTNAAGTSALANDYGIYVNNAPNNLIGGTTSEARNLISGNSSIGIDISGDLGTNTKVQGNYIGTNAAGTSRIANPTGISINVSTNTIIGGTVPGAGNLISGNTSRGISIINAPTTGNRVEGNRFGTDATGTTPITNNSGSSLAVYIYNAPNNTIGGSASGAGNFIASAYEGVLIEGSTVSTNTATGNKVLGNTFGATGLPNAIGVAVVNAPNNTIGGTAGGEENTFFSNTSHAVYINGDAATGNTVRGNSMYANGTTASHQGIDLRGSTGVNPNDSGDADSGPNNLQNFPVLTLALSRGNNTNVEGTLNSTINTQFTLDFYSSPQADHSGYGEGQTYLGSTTATTDATGNKSFAISFPTAITIGRVITATATNPSGSSSEFSQAKTVVNNRVPVATNVTFSGTQGQSFSGLLTVTDADSDTLTYSIVSGTLPAGLTLDSTTGLISGTPANAANGSMVTFKANDGMADSTTVTATFNILEVPSLVVTTVQDVANNKDGLTSLREAITYANSQTSDDTITFNIPAVQAVSGVFNITLAMALPAITGTSGAGTTIDGYSQPGASPNTSSSGTNAVLNIQLSGVNKTFNGLTINTNDCMVKGLIISQFNSGISLGASASGNTVQGNIVGTNAGTSTAANQYGIYVDGSPNNIIGGTNSGEANIIAGNTSAGVMIRGATATGNSVRGNSIYANGTNGSGLGLDLVGATGVDANDSGDADSGPNELQNYPVLSLATSMDGITTIEGTLTGAANMALTVDFYSSPMANVSGYGDGKTYLGSTMLTTDGTGSKSFSASFAVSAIAGHVIAATASDLNGNTSEFSRARRVFDSTAPVATDVTFSGTQGQPFSGQLTATAINDGASLTYSLVSGTLPAGLILDTATGLISGTPTGAANSSIVTFKVSDSNEDSNTATATFNITEAPSLVVTTVQDVISNKDGLTSLREAIIYANSHEGADTITFNISAAQAVSGIYTITPTTSLPTLSGANGASTTIDGYSQPDATPNTLSIGSNAVLKIELNGVSKSFDGLTITTGNCTIKGLVINRFINGIAISGATTSGAVIQGNYVGTNAAGTNTLANDYGVYINTAQSNLIGGTASEARNLLSGNSSYGVYINGSTAANNVVRGNYIGINAASTTPLANSYGIMVASPNNTIGGTGAGAGNLISGNSNYGLYITGATSSGNTVQGNIIGTDATKTNTVRNNAGIGIIESSSNKIGGTQNGAGNLIFGSIFGGVIVSGSQATGNAIRGNSIYAGGFSAFPGIDLFATGPGITPNDNSDGDTGANNLQNYPALSSAVSKDGNTTIEGTLNSTANTQFDLDFYSSPSGGYPDGQTYLGSTSVTTDGTGNVGFNTTFPVMVQVGYVLTATATAPNGSTSEFSQTKAILGRVAPVATNVTLNGVQGQTFSGQLTATDANNDTLTYFIVSGTLPNGLTLNAATGLITGTPTVASDGSTITFKASDGSEESNTATVTFNITEIASLVVSTVQDVTNNKDGLASLREAMTYANSHTGADTITFNIPIAQAINGLFTIVPSVALPTLTGTNGAKTTIDGYSQPGASANTLTVGNNAVFKIEINGNKKPLNGFIISTNGCIIKGLVINQCRYGVYIGGETSSENKVQGNFIGTNVNGIAALPNTHGVFIDGAPDNVIGGTTPATRNVISGNSEYGIYLRYNAARGNVLLGNYLGTNAAGTDALPNINGIYLLNSLNTIIGGSAAGAGNVISGNRSSNIWAQNGATPAQSLLVGGNTIQGNFIGTNATGSAQINNADPNCGGIVMYSSPNNTIGAISPMSARNVISGNSVGVTFQSIESTNNVVQGNYIGTAVDGVTIIPNYYGISLGYASNNTIGGISSGAGNLITGSYRRGIYVYGAQATGNVLRGNSIYANGTATTEIGIDLVGEEGVDINDSGDSDSGPNNLQNFPVLNSAYTRNGMTFIEGTLNSLADKQFILDFYSNPQADKSNHGEGKTYLGSQTVTTNTSGNANFTVSFNIVVTTGHIVTATATAPDNSTSEFCRVKVIQSAPVTSDITFTGAQGQVFNGQLPATDADNDPLTYSIISGTLPVGLILNTTTGVIGGTPSGAAKNAQVTFIANDGTANSFAATATFNISEVSSLVVTTTSDTVNVYDGVTSLREAMNLANSRDGADKITFNIPAHMAVNGVFTISPNGGLPALTGTNALGGAYTTVDGYSQPGASVNTLENGNNAVLKIRLDGGRQPIHGITLSTSGCTIKGLIITRFIKGVSIIQSASSSNKVQGNYLGVDAAGTAGLDNYAGVTIESASNNLVGGTTPEARNILSGNSDEGVAIVANNNTVQGNYIGTDATGMASIPNQTGVFVHGVGNVIGGMATGASNLISGNTNDGVVLGSSDYSRNNQVQSNIIGLNVARTAPIPNTYGIRLFNSSETLITSNVISGNKKDGVAIQKPYSYIECKGNVVRKNSIYGNGTTIDHLGINLDDDGVTANDDGDGDVGPNDAQNYPVLDSTTGTGRSTSVIGRLNSTPNKTFIVDFYVSPEAGVSGYGEGKTHLGERSVTTDGNGQANFSVSFMPGLPVEQIITATATSQGFMSNTSEFSKARSIVDGNHAPVATDITFNGIQGQPFSGSLPANDADNESCTFTIVSGRLPGGLTLNTNTGAISGTPTTTANGVMVTFKANDGAIDSNVATAIFNIAPAPTLSINDLTVSEGTTVPGASDSVRMNFIVRLSKASEQTTTIQYAIQDGTAIATNDYAAASGTLTFAPGEIEKPISITIVGDAIDESDESFKINLSEATGGVLIADSQGIGTIIDDDATPALSINDINVNETNGGSTQAQFTISLSNSSSKAITMSVRSTVAGSPEATSGADYVTLAPTTLTFNPGQISKTVNVTVLGDTLDENNEKFAVTLSEATNATLADATGVGTIVDNDDAPAISVTAVNATEGDEGTATLTFTLKLSAASARNISVQYKTANATTSPATAGTDYTAVPLTTVIFLAGETTKTVPITIKGDILDEDNERITLNVTNPVNAALGTISEGIIVDDDAAPSLSINDLSINEGNSGTKQMLFTVTLSTASARTVTVNAATGNGGTPAATAGTDYMALAPTNITFALGQTSKQVAVTINGDTTVEQNEKFGIILSGAVNATIADNSGIGTILNDDGTQAPVPSSVGVDMQASSSASSVTLVFARAKAVEVANDFKLTLNGKATDVQSIERNGASVVLLLVEDTLKAGDTVNVTWNGGTTQTITE